MYLKVFERQSIEARRYRSVVASASQSMRYAVSERQIPREQICSEWNLPGISLIELQECRE
jgi:hypothetical protein